MIRDRIRITHDWLRSAAVCVAVQVMEEARTVFELVDTDNSGTLSAEEFGAALDRLGFGLTERQVGEVMRVVDTDGNGTIEYAE